MLLRADIQEVAKNYEQIMCISLRNLRLKAQAKSKTQRLKAWLQTSPSTGGPGTAVMQKDQAEQQSQHQGHGQQPRRLTSTSGGLLSLPLDKAFPSNPLPLTSLQTKQTLPFSATREPDSKLITILFAFLKSLFMHLLCPRVCQGLEDRDFCLVYECNSGCIHKNKL